MKQEIIAAFQKTLVSQIEVIKQGTQAINIIKKQQGYCLNLMEIVHDSFIRSDIRQAALIQLKNNIQKRWKKLQKIPNAPNANEYLTENQKNIIRENLLKALITCNRENKFILLYKKIISIIITFDHKSWMPTQTIIQYLKANATNIDVLVHILHYIMSIATSFELAPEESHNIFQNFASIIFPLLLQLVKQYHKNPEIIFLITKIYWKSIYMELGPKMKAESFNWMFLFKEIIEYQNIELMNKYQKIDKFSPEFYYFNTKKWATRIVYRYIQKHANHIYNKKNTQYAQLWFSKFGQGFVESLMSQVPIPTIAKAKYFQIKALTSITQFKPNLIIKYGPNLLYQYLPKYLVLNRNDQLLANQDPLQLLKKQDDTCYSFTNIKSASTDLWRALSQIGGKSSFKQPNPQPGIFLFQNMKFLQQKLKSNNQLEKQMAMYLLCRLRIPIIKIKQIKSVMPLLIEKFILPEFSNPVLFLRARAVQLLYQYGTLQFNSQEVLKSLVQKIYICLTQDNHPIVKIKAASTFNCILKHKQAIQLVKPFLSEILQTYIKMLDVYDLQDIVTSLQGIVTHFSSEITPYAVQLMKHLSIIFFKYSQRDLQKINTQSNYDGGVQMAAAGCIQAMKQILSTSLSEQSYKALQQYIVPVISYSFTSEGCDYLDDGINLLSTYLIKCENLSQQLWFFYPCVIYNVIGLSKQARKVKVQQIVSYQNLIFENIIQNYNFENVEQALPCLRIYINKGYTIIFTQRDFFGVSLLELLLKFINILYVRSEPESIIEKITATAILVNLFQTVRHLSIIILKFAWQIIKINIERTKSKSIKTLNCQLMCLSFFNSPMETFQLLKELNLYEVVFQQIFNYSSNYNEDWQKKRIIIGLSMIYQIKERPKVIADKLVQIFQLHIKLIKMTINSRNNNRQQPDDDTKQLDDNESEQSEYWDQMHDELYVSPLNKVNEFIYFEQSLKKMQAQQLDVYQSLINLMSEQQKIEVTQFLLKQKEDYSKKYKLSENKNT